MNKIFFTSDSPSSIVVAVKLQLFCIFLSLAAITGDLVFFNLNFSSYVLQACAAISYIVFPYNISRRSDLFRFLFVTLEGVGVALYFTSSIPMPPLATISTFVQFPLIGFTIYLLFTRESNSWFASMNEKS